jgi:hypothetical protein
MTGIDEPTVVEGARRRKDAEERNSAHSRSTSAAALQEDEVVRVRRYLQVTAVLVVLLLCMLPFLGGDPEAKRMLFWALPTYLFFNLAMFTVTRNPARYTPTVLVVLGAPQVLAGCFVANYVGFYSFTAAAFLVVTYMIGTGESRALALTTMLSGMFIQCGGMALTALQVIPDRGLVRAHGLSNSTELLLTCVVGVAFVAVFVYARKNRDTTLAAMDGMRRALLEIGKRDELIAEANQDLERVLRAGDGPRTGERIRGWQLGRLLGRGGMGEVYEAVHERDQRHAAVKVLAAHAALDKELVRRFQREAEAMTSLNHPNVVAVEEVGDVLPFIAMELLTGQDLAAILRRRVSLPEAEVLELVTAVAAALEAARTAEIVHRDLKPQNVFRTDDGTWKVLDFGISKLGGASTTLTQGQIVGTPGYMAPEQVEGATVDHRADVFALAGITYRALTGRRAFPGDDARAVMMDVLLRQPAAPSSFSAFTPDVEAVLALGLAKRAQDRPDRAVEFAEALRSATTHDLPPRLRERAAAVLRRHPWGSRTAQGAAGRAPSNRDLA